MKAESIQLGSITPSVLQRELSSRGFQNVQIADVADPSKLTQEVLNVIYRIYVGNLSSSTTADDLIQLFSKFGDVTDAEVVTDRDTDHSKGFGFVQMANDKDGENAVESLNGTIFGNKTIRVSEAQPQPTRNFSAQQAARYEDTREPLAEQTRDVDYEALLNTLRNKPTYKTDPR